MKKIYLCLALVLVNAVAMLAQDVRLNISEQPRPELPVKHGTLDVQGTVVLRVQFLEFGEVGEITPVKELPQGLTQLAVSAARRIKFEPEKKEGKPVTVVREVQYIYSWNGGWRIPSNVSEAVTAGDPAQAQAIVAKAVELLGGQRYLNVRTQASKGSFTTIKEGMAASYQTFLDILIFPDKERTEFKGGGSRFIQVNTGDTGWVFDGDTELVKVQTPEQIANFKKAIRTSLDNLLRGYWKGEAELSYIGKRPATLGKRNDVVRLTYKDGFTVDYEFASDDGMPQKAIHTRTNTDGDEVKEEDRYAQFIEVAGVKVPFIIDRSTNGRSSSRINFDTIEFNRTIPETVFTKPTNAKEAKKDVKY